MVKVDESGDDHSDVRDRDSHAGPVRLVGDDQQARRRMEGVMEQLAQEYDPAVPVTKISENPDNPRRGDDAAVASSMERNGVYGAILLQRSTGHVLAGNTRYRVLRAAGAKTVPAFWIDCDDDTALRIMLADNRTADLAYYDDELLLELLARLAETEALYGTGYTPDDYSDLLARTAPPTLDELGEQWGTTPTGDDGLVPLTFLVTSQVAEVILAYLEALPGESDAERWQALVELLP
jgi:hypothetical protein